MGTMKEKLDAQIKARVSASVKGQFEALAAERHLDTADVLREALRDYLRRQLEGKQQPLALTGKAEAA